LEVSLASFKGTLEKLIHRFESDRPHYLSKSYSEAQARVDFITPFFKALGWDVENEQGLAHHAREVVVEAAEDTRGRPDYGFRVAGQTKFFVEAKAPSEELDTARHIIQAKSYAWNTKQVFFVVLTDFEELRFYDASLVPDERKPDEGLLLKVKYTDYLANAAKLWEFSRERVVAGSLEAFLRRDRRTQRLRIPPDTAFLDEMTGWREELAKNVYKNNPGLTARQLNEIVQRLLDRVVFIRIAEDRRVIEKMQLWEAVEEWRARGGKLHLFEWLNALFHKINEDFNGEIFKPHLSEEIKIDSDLLARIIERLYPPKSPYRFDVIGVELLGSIYERYLGKTIRVTPKQVRVEEKPEVRKAGGVYYTPEYIVDYIVKNTVGKIVEGKTPKQIEKIRILDPACGSGSFLIGAFQCLIDYHVRYLSEHPKEAQGHALFPDIIKDENGEPRLSVVRKADILKNNLFGVDIDPQAVEITMMSLYLKALEGERSQLPPKQHLLPELKYNIICGNSLIGPEISEQATLFGDADIERINAFNWETGFPEIIKAGGFDAVIGNPPYIRIQAMQEWAPVEVEFYKRAYHSASTGNYDIYVVFVEKGLSLLRQQGRLGFILPHKFFNAQYGQPLRSILSKGKHVRHIVHFGDQQVFDGATNYTCLLFLEKSSCPNCDFVKVEDLDSWRNVGKGTKGKIPASSFLSVEWTFAVGEGARLFDKLRQMPVKLDALAEKIAQGIRTSDNGVYVLNLISSGTKVVTADSEALGREVKIERDSISRFLQGREIKPYALLPSGKIVIIPYETDDGGARFLSPQAMKKRFPRTFAYLSANKARLESREHGRMGGNDWYAYVYPKNIEVMKTSKILVPDIADRASFALDERGEYAFTSGYGIVLKGAVTESPKYVLGLLNSSLLDWYLKKISTTMRGGFFRYFTQFVEKLPIRRIDFSNSRDKAQHDKMVRLVERILDMNKRKHSSKLAPSELERLERQIAATDAEIDDLVLKLYDITAEERKIIEGAS